MKRIFTLCIVLCTALTGFAQTDTTGTTSQDKVDTIRIGGMIIIRKNGDKQIYRDRKSDDSSVTIKRRRYQKPSNVSTNWWIIDFGFSNFSDKTNYAAAAASGFTQTPALSSDNFKQRTWKSRNVNIWIVMQRLNMIKHVVNLKYGFGLELNNYSFDDRKVTFQENPTKVVLDNAKDGYKKNKLAMDYLTVPLMMNFNFTPGRTKGFGFSAGVSAGYLYSARQKFKDDGKKFKTKDDFNLERFKLSYIGELMLGPVRLYGSYTPKNIFEKGFDWRPYTVGFRFSNW